MKPYVLFLIAILGLGMIAIKDHQPKIKLIVFEGSDWCANCRRLESKILHDTLFLNYLEKQNIKVERIDFPQRKKITKDQIVYNEALAKKYNFQGVFPTVIIARMDTLLYETISYENQSPSLFIEKISANLKILAHAL